MHPEGQVCPHRFLLSDLDCEAVLRKFDAVESVSREVYFPVRFVREMISTGDLDAVDFQCLLDVEF